MASFLVSVVANCAGRRLKFCCVSRHGNWLDLLEDEALRRAKEYSDTLLIFLLKARRPYKDVESSSPKATSRGG
jgi:hypothetical protein